MTWILLQLIFPLLLLLVPVTLYKSGNRFMTRFYMAMLRSSAARQTVLADFAHCTAVVPLYLCQWTFR